MRAWWSDARHFQIAALSTLLAINFIWIDFGAKPLHSALAITSALATQAVCLRWFGLPRIDLRSALITGLSLSLLLRADEPWLPAIAGSVAIASKFVLRIDGKHIRNPAGFAIVALLLTSGGVWISPGQWGASVWFGALVAFLAVLVLRASQRSDIALFFLGSHAALLVARALWLGDPLVIPLHQLQSGSLLIFTFFMISDPRTTPEFAPGPLGLRIGRGAARPLSGVFHADAAGSVRGADRALARHAAARQAYSRQQVRMDSKHPCKHPWSFSMTPTVRSRLKASVALAAICAQLAVCVEPASAFCGFYVAKADAKMFNKSSKVVLARNGQRTAITMASDYEGEPSEFALVVPVPTFIEKNQISVVEPRMVDHLDAYTAPRLVEYYDPDPCEAARVAAMPVAPSAATMRFDGAVRRVEYRGVKVEATYDVAEYDVVDPVGGRERWPDQLAQRQWVQIPAGAEPVVGSYIKQKMRFFVAKVNVKRMQELGRAYLRPLQVRYQTSKFMLPLRLGTVNANGPQDLIVYALSKRGRVEATNYRTVKVPSDFDVPLFVKDDFTNFYRATFDRAVAREKMHAVFVEYAWDMGWCDPCAADPMSIGELVDLGAGWITSSPPGDTANSPYVTRLHVRYDATSFPEDLNFIETGDRENFQGRYIMHHPAVAKTSCSASEAYRAALPARFRREAQILADATGWSQKEIEARMNANGQSMTNQK